MFGREWSRYSWDREGSARAPDEVGGMAAVGAPCREAERWSVPVVLRPEGQPLGTLFFRLDGTMFLPESSAPQDLSQAADAA